MRGPAGAGKSAIARQLASAGMVPLSFDEAAWHLSRRTMPLAQETQREIEAALQAVTPAGVKDLRGLVCGWIRRANNRYSRLLRLGFLDPMSARIRLLTRGDVLQGRREYFNVHGLTSLTLRSYRCYWCRYGAAALVRREQPWPALVPVAIVAALLVNWILRW